MASLEFMTVSASLLILAGLVLRAAFSRRVPRSVFMALWGLVVLRLLVPVELPFAMSLFTLFRRSAPHRPLSVQSGLILSEAAPSLAVPAGDSAPAGLPLFLSVYVGGALLLALLILLNHARLLRHCRRKTLRFVMNGRVRVYTAAVDTPFVCGLFRPKILLPETLSDADREAVLRHELAHIRGLDVLKKYALAAALCVNWFNPLVWLMVRLALSDMELLCDARATESLSPAARGAYAHALINAEERRTSLALAFKSDTEVRIMNILHPKKAGVPLTVLAVLCTVVLAAACATSPAPESSTAPVTLEETVSVAPGKTEELNSLLENLSLKKRKLPDVSAYSLYTPLRTYETNLKPRNLSDDEYKFFVERLIEIAGEQLTLAENERVVVSMPADDNILVHVCDYKRERAEREEQMKLLIAAVSEEQRQKWEAEEENLLVQHEIQMTAKYYDSARACAEDAAGIVALYSANATETDTRSISICTPVPDETLLTVRVAQDNYDACLEELKAHFTFQNVVIKLSY